MKLRPDVADHPARILIVDDERQNRQLLEVMLAPEGFHIETAASGEETIHKVAQQPPDLILLDVMMPGMDGYQVARTLKDNLSTKNIPIIMVTALDNRDARMLGLSAGAEDFLSKPVDRAELCVRVRNLLRLKAYGEYYNEYSQVLEVEVAARTADLVERTKALERQAAVLSEQAALLDLPQDGIIVRDMDSHILFWSRGAEVIYGWLSKEALGTIMDELLKTEFSESAEHIDEELRDRGQWEGELIHYRRDGTRLNIATRCTLQRGADGTPIRVLAINNDISERKNLEQQQRQSQKMEAVGQLAGGIAHDFNNLLGVIIGYSDILLERLPPGQQFHKDVQQINKAGSRAALLTRQLLAFSRKQVLQPVVLDLNAVLADTEKLLRRLIGENIELLVVPGQKPGTVKADPGQLEQIIMNLAVNARDSMPKGGKLTIKTAILEVDREFACHDSAAKPGRYVLLTMTDTGCGMDAKTQTHIFEPFFTTKGVGKGTGLGLSIVYGVVKQSGGFVRVDSELDRGTAFEIYLPVAGELLKMERPIEKSPEEYLGSEIILVVEDDADLRVLVRRSLEEVGYTILEADGSAEAVEISERYEGHIHLMVTDVVMPGMSGRELADHLIVLRPEMKVLYVSGYTDDAIIHHRMLEPGLAFLQKPFSPRALAHKVRAVLNSASQGLARTQP